MLLVLQLLCIFFVALRSEAARGGSQEKVRALLDNGWKLVGPKHAYKLTLDEVNFSRGRQICQSWGGDIAVEGIRTSPNIRRKVGRHLYRGPEWIGLWVGITDTDVEGSFKWLDGKPALNSDLPWSPNEPSHSTGEDCIEIWGAERDFTLNDVSCNALRYGLCEKLVYDD
ncbi:C-type lectin domain family 4 member M-like [Clavelina lepadiformis]|uniref:C-type lectin domain-containing protein n=1 Tax=Clavelina lepadiformis TaxID=159417 RepID=A0ABP0H6G2_CLALP